MVLGPSVSERVVDDVLAVLRTIDGPPGYEHDVSEGVHLNGNPLQLQSIPALVVFDAGHRDREGPGRNAPNGLVTIEHSLDIVGVVPASEEGWQASVRRLLVDAAAKLREDFQRTGLALDTRVEGTEIWDSDESAASTPFGMGALSITVLYRHLFEDPTQAF